MNNYEIMFILRPTLSEEEIGQSVDKYKKILEDNGGKVLDVKKTGQQELAYEIKKFKTGYYYLFLVEAKDDLATKEFDRVSLISDDIIRHLITKKED